MTKGCQKNVDVYCVKGSMQGKWGLYRKSYKKITIFLIFFKKGLVFF